VVELLERLFPGIYVHNLVIGDHTEQGASLFWSMGKQINSICEQLRDDPMLNNTKINVVGFSQGGVGLRGFLERCNYPPVRNFISWHAPQGGQFGCPGINGVPGFNITCARLFSCCTYTELTQNQLSVAEYWITPFRYEDYVEKSRLLADIDNLRPNKNETYKQNMLSLENFVMSMSSVETVLNPPESSWFGFYAPGQADIVQPLEDMDMYKNDWNGLRTLAETGRLHRFMTDCPHSDFGSQCFDHYFIANVVPFLNNTI